MTMATTFGKDISCGASLKSGRFVSGVRLVAEAAYRRLTTPRGTLRGGEEEANYGFDLTEVIGAVTTRGAIAALSGRIRNELLKDERIDDVKVTIVDRTFGVAFEYEILVAGTTSEGPFALQLSATDVTVELIGITTEAA